MQTVNCSLFLSNKSCKFIKYFCVFKVLKKFASFPLNQKNFSSCWGGGSVFLTLHIGITLSIIINSFKIGKDLTEPFDTMWGFGYGDSFSCAFFNIMLEKVTYAANLNRRDIISWTYYEGVRSWHWHHRPEQQSRQSSSFSNEKRNKRGWSFCKRGQDKVPGDHTQIFLTSWELRLCWSFKFEKVKDFVFLGTNTNTINNLSLEIKRSACLLL